MPRRQNEKVNVCYVCGRPDDVDDGCSSGHHEAGFCQAGQHDICQDVEYSSEISGKVSDDGKTFVSDKDNKSWTVSNPDALKGHEGHQVTVSANVYADKNEINVVSVEMGKKDSMK